MKAKVAANGLSGNIDELTHSAHRSFAELAPHPVQLPDISGRAPKLAVGSFIGTAPGLVRLLQAS